MEYLQSSLDSTKIWTRKILFLLSHCSRKTIEIFRDLANELPV